VDADERVLGSSHSAESIFLVVEAESAQAAAAMAEDVVRGAFPTDAAIQATQIFDEGGNVF
jgi:hypothetical protein